MYDVTGRRVRKTVYTYNGTTETWVQTGDTKVVWAGWLLLLELDGTDSDAVLRKYTWGLDVAGQNGQFNSLESAGGIGGLLAVYDTNGTTTGQNPTEDDKTYVYLYDANGNVGQLVDWSDIPDWEIKQLTSAQDWHADRLVARYEYDPYGNVVGPDTDSDGDWTDDAGPYATVNPFRFSTKYWDDETGLGYWGYRYYSPTLGRWISRDPIEETGAALVHRVAAKTLSVSPDPVGVERHVYVYVKNAPTMYVDPCGLKKCAPATGSLRCFMQKHAADYSPFTRSGKPDPHNRINWKLLSCLACQESGFDPCAMGPTNDFGLMQLTRTGAIAQCQKMGILKTFDVAESSEDRRKKCCSLACQPRCGLLTITLRGVFYLLPYEECKCCEGCEDSIWNIDNQIRCAAAYLRYLRDSRKGTVTLPMLICMYNRGLAAVDCQNDASARKVDYVRSVLECLGHLDQMKPNVSGAVSPPKELQ